MKPAPKNNQYAKGNKGGGRKPLRVEMDILKRIEQYFSGDNEVSFNELKEKVESGKANMLEVGILKAFSSESVYNNFLNKLVPSKQSIEQTLPHQEKILEAAKGVTEWLEQTKKEKRGGNNESH